MTVITCAPNFPNGRVFEGYRNRLWQQGDDGRHPRRPCVELHHRQRRLPRRVLDYMSYMLQAALASLFVRRVDVVIGTSPQFFTAVRRLGVGALKRVPFIFELRDLWPESIKAVGAMQDSAPARLDRELELFLYRRATRIVSVTHSFRARWAPRHRHGQDRRRDQRGGHARASRRDQRTRDWSASSASKAASSPATSARTAWRMRWRRCCRPQLGSDGTRRATRIRLLLLGDGARKAEL